mmetsp:Transcript_9776/g.19484  ORF Transcript_9776/g.19484 Transcript_9776/m.19484 type:complete len:272 (+) Transcript_9776:156-971(+)
MSHFPPPQTGFFFTALRRALRSAEVQGRGARAALSMASLASASSFLLAFSLSASRKAFSAPALQLAYTSRTFWTPEVSRLSSDPPRACESAGSVSRSSFSASISTSSLHCTRLSQFPSQPVSKALSASLRNRFLALRRAFFSLSFLSLRLAARTFLSSSSSAACFSASSFAFASRSAFSLISLSALLAFSSFSLLTLSFSLLSLGSAALAWSTSIVTLSTSLRFIFFASVSISACMRRLSHLSSAASMSWLSFLEATRVKSRHDSNRTQKL